MTRDPIVLWKARNLDNEFFTGLEFGIKSKEVQKKLVKKGLFKIELKLISESLRKSPASDIEILSFLKSIVLYLKTGFSLLETINYLTSQKQPLKLQFVFCALSQSLHDGRSLKEAFETLKPIFPSIFVSFLSISEKSGFLIPNLQSLVKLYSKKIKLKNEIDKLTRYPKTIAIASLLLMSVVIIFIIPMFKDIYSLFDNDLPVFTQILVILSDFVNSNTLPILGISFCIIIISVFDRFRRFNPVYLAYQKLTEKMSITNDNLLYAQSMVVLLQSGCPLYRATLDAAKMLSPGRKHSALKISKYLEEGFSLGESFRKIKRFPDIFHRMISSTEKAGDIALGFEQISEYLEEKREIRINNLMRFIEPATMIFLGAIVLVVLLAIYLPIFDLGNKFG